MQDRYTGDVGDFIKYALLRAVSVDKNIGVAWYRFPDESHNNDGKHIGYLKDPAKYRSLDPVLFDELKRIVDQDKRSLGMIESSNILIDSIFSNELLNFTVPKKGRAKIRTEWFSRCLSELTNCDIVFADPDNGLCEDEKYNYYDPKYYKRIPLSEAMALSEGRTGIIYHHNSRFKGGHLEEIKYWLNKFPNPTFAIYSKLSSPRSFFIINPSAEIYARLESFADQWSQHVSIYSTNSFSKKGNVDIIEKSEPQACPECGYIFKGRGWTGLDSHWKSNHLEIMPYNKAKGIIKSGGKPSTQ